MEPPKAVVQIRDWPGLVLAAGPHSLPPGAAQDQVNCVSINDGELRSRGGIKVVSFDWSTTES